MPRQIMPRHVNRRAKSLRRKGISLTELLISMAITSALLTAVAVATDASFKAYAVNTLLADRTQSCRVAMHRIMTGIRTAREHAPFTAGKSISFAAGEVVTDSGLRLYDANDDLITIHHDVPNRRLLMTVETGTSTTQYVLLQNVEAFSVTLEPVRSAASTRTAGSFDLLKRASIVLSVGEGVNRADVDESLASENVTFSAAVAPRRNTW